ncbi:MAG: hypothetical protein AAGD09_03305 [Cyanobacteria bacterium P01_F01_bin.56]
MSKGNNPNNSNFPTTYRHMEYDDSHLLKLAYESDKTLRSLEDAKKRIEILKILRYGAWIIIAADVWFTYQAVLTYSESDTMAMSVALIVGAVQVVVNMAIFSQQLGPLLRGDLNNDGVSEWYEKLAAFFILSIVVGCYLLNIGTNMLGIDADGVSRMGVDLAALLINLLPSFLSFLVPILQAIAPLFSLALATGICLADEVVVLLCDRMIATTTNALPDLQKAHSHQERRSRKAQGYAEYLSQSDARGEGFADAQRVVGR